MQRVRVPELEWRLHRAPVRPWIWLVLALAIVAQVFLQKARAAMEVRASIAEAALEHALAEALAAPARTRPMQARSPAELRQLRTQIALFNRDWVELFANVSPAAPEVRLLEVDVNAETGAIGLAGIAPDADAANLYAEALQKNAKRLGDVNLLLLERRPEGIRFEVAARWAE
jgi:hypothetical protein